MTVTIRPLVPGSTRPPLAEGAGRFAGRRALPLPLPILRTGRTGDVRYAVTAVDAGGRLGDRTLLEFLGWAPGTPVAADSDARSVIVVAVAPGGALRVSARGHLRLPAALRHRCGLQPGGRLLMAADPDRGQLRCYPAAVLDALLPDPADHPGGHSTAGHRR